MVPNVLGISNWVISCVAKLKYDRGLSYRDDSFYYSLKFNAGNTTKHEKIVHITGVV